MILSLIIVPVVSILTPRPDRALVEQVFSCYERKVLVTVKDSIGDQEA